LAHGLRNLIFLFCIVFASHSCKAQDENKELSCEKVYVVECKWIFSEENAKTIFRIVGFSELDKSFNLHCAYQSTDDQYYTSNILIVDSLRDKISDIINEYPTDVFLYHGRIDNRNLHIFIFQKNDDEFIRIYFNPEVLPQDLLFLYTYLYESRKNQVKESQYTELFTTLEKIIMKDVFPPPPMLKETIQFTPPVIKNKKL